MKSRKQKALEYKDKYSDIPKDYIERLNWMYDKYKITEAKALEIIQTRDEMVNFFYYKTLNIVLYEEPEGAPRPRARLINRNNILDAARSNAEFIHIYSPSGSSDQAFMKKLTTEEDFLEVGQLLCTPCDVQFTAYFKTPSYFSKVDLFLSEIGVIRPITKPDWDNIGKKYSDMYNSNIWIDDMLTISGSVNKFYSILPRVEIRLMYLNAVYNRHQYKSITGRKDYNESFNLEYFNKK